MHLVAKIPFALYVSYEGRAHAASKSLLQVFENSSSNKQKKPEKYTSPGTDAAFLCECPANWIAIFGTTLGRYYQAKQFSNQHHQLVTMRFKDFFSNVLKLN